MKKYIVEKDGDMWCAHDDNFTNLQEYHATFGYNPVGALYKFIMEERSCEK